MHVQPNPPQAPVDSVTIRWTRDKVITFIRALADCGSVAGAARAAGMSRKAAYALRKRRGPGFAAAWDSALGLGREERQLRRRGRYAAAR